MYYNRNGAVAIPLPRCASDSVGLLAAYLSHSALQPADIWRVFSPYVVLVESDDRLSQAFAAVPGAATAAGNARRTGAGAGSGSGSGSGAGAGAGTASSEHEGDGEGLSPLGALREMSNWFVWGVGDLLDDEGEEGRVRPPFLAVGRKKAVLLNLAPASDLVHRLIRLGAWGADKVEGETIKLDRATLSRGVNALRARVDEHKGGWVVLAPLVICSFLCGLFVGVLASFDFLITSTFAHAAALTGALTPSFRLWDLRSHVRHLPSRPGWRGHQDVFESTRRNFMALSEAELRDEQLRAEAFARATPLRDLMGERGDAFFVGLAVHLATPGLLITAFWPGSLLLHIALTLVVLRFYALPGLVLDSFLLLSDAQRARFGWTALRRASAGAPPASAARRAPARGRGGPRGEPLGAGGGWGGPPPPGAADDQRLAQWECFHREQQALVARLLGPGELQDKLADAADRMAALRHLVLEGRVHILHHWSRLCRAGGPGGPGVCYGLALGSGAWVQLCSYDHPCSEAGAAALAAFPGQVLYDDDNDYPRSLLPSQAELDALGERLRSLKQQLAALAE